jgi:hypothetical protein
MTAGASKTRFRRPTFDLAHDAGSLQALHRLAMMRLA